MHEERIYRDWVKSNDLKGFEVTVKETDLLVGAESDLSIETADIIRKFRAQINEYIAGDPEFKTTFKPHTVKEKAPLIVKEMAQTASLAGVGPFASVAGAIAEYVGKGLLAYSKQVIVENGGDIFIKSSKDRSVGIYAGQSKFNGKIALRVKGRQTPLGICTSSGTLGHSLSFGKADAVVVLSKSTLLADAAATSIANLIKDPKDISKGIEFAKGIKGISGVLIIKDDKMGIWGKIEICG